MLCTRAQAAAAAAAASSSAVAHAQKCDAKIEKNQMKSPSARVKISGTPKIEQLEEPLFG